MKINLVRKCVLASYQRHRQSVGGPEDAIIRQLSAKLLPDRVTGFQNTAFYQKSGIVSDRIHNKYYYPVSCCGCRWSTWSPEPRGLPSHYAHHCQNKVAVLQVHKFFELVRRKSRLGDPYFESQQGQEISFFSKMSWPAMVVIHPSIQRMWGLLRHTRNQWRASQRFL